MISSTDSPYPLIVGEAALVDLAADQTGRDTAMQHAAPPDGRELVVLARPVVADLSRARAPQATLLPGSVGRFDEAVGLARGAVEQDPLSASAYFCRLLADLGLIANGLTSIQN